MLKMLLLAAGLALTAPVLAEAPPSDAGSVISSSRIAERAAGWRLARWAESRGDGTAMYIAALMVGDSRTSTDRKITTDANTVDVSKPALLAKARSLANGDRSLLAQIEAAAADASKGALVQRFAMSAVVPPGQTRTFNFAAKASEPLEIVLYKDGPSNPTVEVSDERGRLVPCQLRGRAIGCRTVPAFEGMFRVRVRNTDKVVSQLSIESN